MTALLDAGALIAIDKRDRAVGGMLRVLQRDGMPVVTSSTVVAQVWRDPQRQVNVARVLTGVDIAALDDAAPKKVGELLRANRSSDLADAQLSLLVEAGDQLLTSDEADLSALLRTRRVKASIVRV